LLNPGKSTQANLAHCIGAAFVTLLSISTIFGRLNKLCHDVIQLLDLKYEE
jgi:hypothetical protein